MEMGSPVVQDRDRTAQQGWGTGIIFLCCLRPVTKSLMLTVLTSPLRGRSVQHPFAVGQGLGQQAPESARVNGAQQCLGWLGDIHTSVCRCSADVAWFICVLAAVCVMGIMVFPTDAVGMQPSTPGRQEITLF